MNRISLSFLLFLFGASISIHAAENANQARLLRFPSIGGGKIVFSYAGNLYSVDENGGKAAKLTSHIGYECFARISPDGKAIAFTGQYDGNTEVYTIPIEGGTPKRITYSALVSRDNVGERMGPNNIVMGWTPDGKQILYRSKQWCFSGLRAQLCTVDAQGGTPQEIPTTEGGFCSYSPDGKKLAMNRMFREFRTWKYYRGGQADDIWIHTLGTTKLEQIPGCDAEAQDIFPMWVGNKIYYLSDRDRTMNLFAYDTQEETTDKLTQFEEYDCKFPSCSQQAIVFENGGYIYRYDVQDGSCKQIPITLADDDLFARTENGNAESLISDVDLSPDGKQVVAVGRGDIFLLPATKGPVRNISHSPQSHEREVCWSPDGKQLAWLSDASGEYQVWIAQVDKPSEGKQLTHFTDGYPSALQWSPDSKKLYFSTDKREFYELPIEKGKAECILQGEISPIRSFTLSSDGTWAAYCTTMANHVNAIFLFDVAKRKSYQLTDRWYDAHQPCFSRDGKYLFFASYNVFAATYSQVEWNTSYSTRQSLFVVPLAQDTPDPTRLQTDFDEASSSASEKTADKEKDKEKKDSLMRVDIEDIGQRISILPLDAGNYYIIDAQNGKLYYTSSGSTKQLDLETLKTTDCPMSSPYASTPDGKKVLLRDGNKYAVVNFGSSAKDASVVPTADMDILIDRQTEWKQIFDESWRITRDGFYVTNMHGADWQHVHDKYAEMLPYVKHRDDLTYLIGEMLGELNVGHAYITSGEKPQVERIPTGLLGAKFSRDAQTKAFRIEKIFRGSTWDKSLRSPLRAAGVQAKEGEYILAVNELQAKDLTDIGQALVGKVDKVVSLVLASDAKGKDARTVYVRPIADEIPLAYHEWVQTNIEKVDKLSDGQIGYIHIPDMSVEGLNCFTKLFYSQLDKKALIVDDRMNGGGNVSPMILERLQREVYRMSMYRNGGTRTVPNEAHYGPKVCLIDKYSSSDGDLFPYGFRQLGLGKLIGKRSWGGIVGISGSKPFVDGQDMRTPFFTSYSTEGEWIIEGHGVDPDIEVDINPFEDYMGKDAQLEKAVQVLQEELKNWKPLPGVPQPPVKN